jgi:hypothetical protein
LERALTGIHSRLHLGRIWLVGDELVRENSGKHCSHFQLLTTFYIVVNVYNTLLYRYGLVWG